MEHPSLLTVNGRPYRIVRLLGRGKGGYSYLAEDEAGQYVLKQIHHEPCDYYQFGDKMAAELQDYQTLCAAGVPMPRLLDADRAAERILKEYIPGDTIYELVRTGQMQPDYLEQMRAVCRLLAPAGLNIDYYPTNFIPCGGVLYYIDYECNPYDPQWSFENWGIQYWSRTPAFEATLQG